jgi:hypothetical protein
MSGKIMSKSLKKQIKNKVWTKVVLVTRVDVRSVDDNYICQKLWFYVRVQIGDKVWDQVFDQVLTKVWTKVCKS